MKEQRTEALIFISTIDAMRAELRALKAERERLRKALADIANRAVRIREDKAVVGIEATFIERIARATLKRTGS